MTRSMGVARTVVAAAVTVAVLVGVASAASAGKAVSGATYRGGGTELVVDAAGSAVRVLRLPVHARCKGAAPTNEGDYGSGLGPFAIASDGTFTNVAKGAKPMATQTVIKGRFAGADARGTVVVPAFKDKGFDCARFSGSWKATRVKGTGDTTKPGATYATDDFSNRSSGFATFNGTKSYAEYLTDHRFRIGTREPTAVASLRDQPVISTADVSATIGYTSGSGADAAGLACLGTGSTSFIAGFVAVDGTVGLLRYANGQIAERATDRQAPAGLLRTGPQAQNEVRMTCAPLSSNPTRTDVRLFLNGKEVSAATASAAGAGKVGLFVGSSTGTTEFTFSHFEVRKPRS